MSKKIWFLIISNFLIKVAFSQIEEEKSLKEFNSGEVLKYSSFNEPKAENLKIHIKYPKSWECLEGERPHVIRKFIQSEGYSTCILLITKQNKEPNTKEVDNILAIDGLKSLIPSTASYIASNSNLRMEGLRAASIEYTNSGRRLDRDFYSYNLLYLFVYKKFIIQVQFMVLNKIEETNSSVEQRYKTIRPLFNQMFNSIVLDNIYQN